MQLLGGIAAGVRYGAGKLVANCVFKNSGMTFNNYYELGIIDTGVIRASYHAFRASWYTFSPNIAAASSRGLIKYLGNKGIGWSE